MVVLAVAVAAVPATEAETVVEAGLELAFAAGLAPELVEAGPGIVAVPEAVVVVGFVDAAVAVVDVGVVLVAARVEARAPDLSEHEFATGIAVQKLMETVADGVAAFGGPSGSVILVAAAAAGSGAGARQHLAAGRLQLENLQASA